MITKLTKQQEAKFPEYVEKWIQIGLSTAPIDRASSDRILQLLFGQIKKSAPSHCLFCHSPLEAAYIICLFRSDNVRANVSDNVRANVSDNVRANVRDNVRANVSDNVRANVRDNVSDNVLANVRDNVLANVLANVRDNVLDNVRANVSANVSDNVRANVSDNVRANVRANVSDNVLTNVRDNVLANVRDNVLDNVSDNVSANVSDNVRANVLDNVSDNVSANVSDNVRANVSDNVRANVSDNVLTNVRDNVSDLFNYYYWDFGQFASAWLSWYDFFAIELDQDIAPLHGNMEMCKSFGWSFLFWEWAFVSERPIAIHRNDRRQLHKDGAAALEYSDGFGVWALNGVRMQPEYILTPAEQLQPEQVLQETNADVRRELIRKIGIERMLAKLPHKSLDKRGDYELLSVKLSEQVRDARYLKMINPSIGVFHMEGEPPEIDTIEKALNRRNQQWFTDAEILT